MIKFLLSLILLTLIITYAIMPTIHFLVMFVKAEGKRIDKLLTKGGDKNE